LGGGGGLCDEILRLGSSILEALHAIQSSAGPPWWGGGELVSRGIASGSPIHSKA
jgi:hypothetical protein